MAADCNSRAPRFNSSPLKGVVEDFALYNQGYKALSLLITILASVVMNRLLSRGPRESGNRPAPKYFSAAGDVGEGKGQISPAE